MRGEADDRSMSDPSSWITRFAPLVPAGGAVLDLAAGGGRHSRLFLDRSHPVTAVDRDVSQLAALQGGSGLEVVEADLEDGSPWPLDGRRFAAVVVANYLWRPLFERILGAVAPGGVLLYATFMIGHERFGPPTNPDFLLHPDELLDRVRPELRVIAFEQGTVASPRPAVRQRIAAIRSESTGSLPSCR